MKKLLIVDDSKELLDAMKIFLEKKNYLVKGISNYKDIFKVAKEFQPDLLILDVFLSGADGRELCRKLREHNETKFLCIMMFSASPEALSSHDEYGADGSIEKPFTLDSMIEKIESVLNGCKDNVYKGSDTINQPGVE
jgi:DNA-binding response OmpR family regulator